MSVDVEDFLEHHGIKGQHWGIRNEIQKARGEVHGLKLKLDKHKKLKVGLEIGVGAGAAALLAAGAIHGHRALQAHAAESIKGLKPIAGLHGDLKDPLAEELKNHWNVRPTANGLRLISPTPGVISRD